MQNNLSIKFLFVTISSFVMLSACDKNTEGYEHTLEKSWLNSFTGKVSSFNNLNDNKRIEHLDSLKAVLNENDSTSLDYAEYIFKNAISEIRSENIEGFLRKIEHFLSLPQVKSNTEYKTNGIISKISTLVKTDDKEGVASILENLDTSTVMINNPYLRLRFKGAISHAYFEVLQVQNSLDIGYKAIDDFEALIAISSPEEKKILFKELIDLQNHVSLLLIDLAKYDEAMKVLKQAEDNFQYIDTASSNFDNFFITKTYNNISIVYQNLDELEESSRYLRKAIEKNKNTEGSFYYLITNYYNLGLNLIDQEEYSEALDVFRKGLNMSKSKQFLPGLGYNYFGIGSSYFKDKKIDSALYYLHKAEDIMLELDNKAILSNTYKILTQIYEQKNNLKKALYYQKEILDLEKLYHEIVLNRDVEELNIKHKVEKINTENDFLSKKVQLQQNISEQKNLLLVTLGSIVCMTFIFLFFLNRSKNKMIKMYDLLKLQKEEINAKNDSLNELFKERDALVKTIIHDLRNPLATIQGFTHLLEEDNTEDEKKLFLDMLHAASNQLDVLISSLLQTYSEEKSLNEKDLQEINVKTFLEQVYKGFEFEAGTKSIKIIAELEEFTTKTNKNGLYSIFGNLLSNAIKFSPENTQIYIHAEMSHNGWILKVRDEGPGFSEKDKTKMFEIFTTLSAFPTKNEMSTGIGLYSVRKTIEKLGGTIKLNEDYTSGAEFICFFPKVIPIK